MIALPEKLYNYFNRVPNILVGLPGMFNFVKSMSFKFLNEEYRISLFLLKFPFLPINKVSSLYIFIHVIHLFKVPWKFIIIVVIANHLFSFISFLSG